MVRSRSSIVLGAMIAAVACSTPYGGDDDPRPVDAGSDDAAPGDAGGVDGTTSDAGDVRCDPTKPFSTPVPVGGVNNNADEDDGARPAENERSIIFTSNRGAAPKRTRFHFALRSTADEAFQAPTVLFEDASEPVFDHAIAADGLSMIFQQGGTTQPARLRVTKRDNPQAAFGTAVDLDGSHATGQDERDPFLTSDGHVLFSRNATDGSVAGNLFIGTRGSITAIADVAPIKELNTPSIERDPVLSQDNKEIFFSSDRNGTGKLRLFRATRGSTTEQFTPPVQIAELSSGTNAYDAPTWLSADRCVLYFSSDRAGSTDVYRATRPK